MPILIDHINAATMSESQGVPYGAVKDAAIVIDGQHIVWLGSRADLPPQYRDIEAVDGQGNWALPGLIDCHTHIVYGGQRAAEFEMRLEGVSYEEIARRGGGIRSTVAMTREAPLNELVDTAAERLSELRREGVTLVEVKSGYGLDLEAERKQLTAAGQAAERAHVDIRRTFLGAHTVPPEFDNKADNYIDLVCNGMLPSLAAAGLVDAVDAFCESIAFSPAQTRRVFETAHAHNLPVKLHADQLTNGGGAALAAEFDALSADHVEFCDEAGARAMAKHGTTAVLLPGAFYFLGESQKPPVDLFRRHRVPMAVSTDSNPGSSPTTSLLLMISMACTFFRLTPEEAIKGVTTAAARALGAAPEHGALTPGSLANIAFFKISQPAELAYRIGHNPCVGRCYRGQLTFFE